MGKRKYPKHSKIFTTIKFYDFHDFDSKEINFYFIVIVATMWCRRLYLFFCLKKHFFLCSFLQIFDSNVSRTKRYLTSNLKLTPIIPLWSQNNFKSFFQTSPFTIYDEKRSCKIICLAWQYKKLLLKSSLLEVLNKFTEVPLATKTREMEYIEHSSYNTFYPFQNKLEIHQHLHSVKMLCAYE